jgi:hypothetical protein
MATKGNVEVVIDPKGNVTIKATGFRGPACEKATKEIEEALGLVTGRKKTPEAYLTDKTGAQQSVKR